MCLSLFHVIIRFLKILFNTIKHLALLLNQHGKFLKKFKKFINWLFQLHYSFILSLNIVDCIFDFRMSSLTHNLLLHQFLHWFRIASQCFDFLLSCVFLSQSDLFFESCIDSVFEFCLNCLRCSQHISELRGQCSVQRFLYSSLRFVSLWTSFTFL